MTIDVKRRSFLFGATATILLPERTFYLMPRRQLYIDPRLISIYADLEWVEIKAISSIAVWIDAPFTAEQLAPAQEGKA